MQTDRARVQTIHRAVELVIQETTRERAGLAERLRAATDQASMLVGTDTFEYLDRDASSEQQLKEAETQMKHAGSRLGELESFQKKIDVIAQAVDALSQELAPGRAGAATAKNTLA